MSATIDSVQAVAYRFPTPAPEADGTLEWDATVAVVVTVRCGEHTGLGWTFSSPAAREVVRHHLADAVRDVGVHDITAGYEAMRRACRNIGTSGLVAQAISAVDIAWWDLKSRLLQVPLTALLGSVRDSVPIYGSGGFTTMTADGLAEQVSTWQDAGCAAMKIKIGESWGARVDRDLERVAALRHCAGDGVELMVDANGGYAVGQARRVGAHLDELGVGWFEEPVSSDDVTGLASVRSQVRCDVAAGEYIGELSQARHLLPAVDCLQLDATRCGGYTGWLAAAALARSASRPVSAHCAPALHAYVGCAVPHLRHVEWFADHARLEPLLVDGLPAVRDGRLYPQRRSPGHGMTLAASAREYLLTA